MSSYAGKALQLADPPAPARSLAMAYGPAREPSMTARIESIAELAAELDKTLVKHNQADHAAIAAYHPKDDREDARASAEMARLDKTKAMLIKAVSRGRATSRDDAITQAIIATYWVKLVSEGQRRKDLRHALAALASALSVLAAESTAVPPT